MESITQFLHWLEKTPVAIFVSQSPGGFSGLVMIHVGAAVIVFGMIVVVDLRLLGLSSKGCSVTDLCREALPWTWTAFIISAITGVLLFTGQAVKYSANYAFQATLGQRTNLGGMLSPNDGVVNWAACTTGRSQPGPLFGLCQSRFYQWVAQPVIQEKK